MVKPNASSLPAPGNASDAEPMAVWSKRTSITGASLNGTSGSTETLLESLGRFQSILERPGAPDTRIRTRPSGELSTEARAWQQLQAQTRTLSPQAQKGLAPFTPPDLSLVTLSTERIEQTLEESGSFGALCARVEAGIQQGSLHLVGERLLLLQPESPNDERSTDADLTVKAPRSFDITATARVVAGRFLAAEPEVEGPFTLGPAASPQARALVRLLQTRLPERDDTHIQPIVSSPGPSPALVRSRNEYLGSRLEPVAGTSAQGLSAGVTPPTGQASPSVHSPLGEPMPTLTMPGRRQRARGQTASSRPGMRTPTRPRSAASAHSPGQVTSRSGAGAGSSRPRSNARASIPSGRPNGGPIPKGSVRSGEEGSSPQASGPKLRPRPEPKVLPGAPMRVESTLNELARVIRQEQRQEQEDAHDRTF